MACTELEFFLSKTKRVVEAHPLRPVAERLLDLLVDALRERGISLPIREE